MSADTHGALGRAKLTTVQRVSLLEADREAQSRVITALVEGSKTFTPEQVAQLRAVMLDVLGDAGLRLGEAAQEDEARRDFMFLRAFRKGTSGLASGIGWLVIASLVGGVMWLVNAGLNAWK